jgi:1-acyl-sn-glycerol-3-phosphate acyltransferase
MIIRAILRFVMRIAFRMQVEGKDNVPSQGGVILAANHLSMLDPIVVGCAIDRPVRFMAKRELFDNPLLRMLARSLGAFPVIRSFLPGRLFFSRRATVAPSDAALPAAIKPAGPAPTTMMSFRKTLPLLPTLPPCSGSSPLLLQ